MECLANRRSDNPGSPVYHCSSDERCFYSSSRMCFIHLFYTQASVRSTCSLLTVTDIVAQAIQYI